MSRSFSSFCLIVALGFFGWLSLPVAVAQHGSEGTVAVTVLDPSGSTVAGAEVELVDLATSSTRKGESHEAGNFTFVNLSLGKYRLTITKSGFQTQVYNDVIVEAAQDPVSAVADISASIDKVKKAGRKAILLRLEDSKGDLRFVAVPLS